MKSGLKWLLIFCLTMTFGRVQGQLFNLGAHAGLNYPDVKIKNSNLDTYRNFGGMTVGIWARMGGLFYVQPEVNYCWSRAAVQSQQPSGGITDQVNMHHIQLAVSPAFRPIRKSFFNIRMGGTASYSFLLNVNANELGINRQDFKTGALHLGPFLGMDIWRITLDARYLWGVGNQLSGMPGKWRTDMVQATLGFRFIGKK